MHTLDKVPTAGERLATLEEQMRNMREDVHFIADAMGDKSRPDTIRGRLHKIEGYIESAVGRRALGMGLLRGWVQTVLVACAVATVIATWYSVLHK